MPFKVVVPATISEAIGSFRLPRPVLIQLLTTIHEDLARDYPKFKVWRTTKDERCCAYRIIVHEGASVHYFPIALDDCTAPDKLILTAISYYVS
jgi:hypothetical protein